MSQRCSRATEKPQRKGENLFRYHVVWDLITWQVEWMHEWWELNPSYQTEMQSRNNVLAAMQSLYATWGQGWSIHSSGDKLELYLERVQDYFLATTAAYGRWLIT